MYGAVFIVAFALGGFAYAEVVMDDGKRRHTVMPAGVGHSLLCGTAPSLARRPLQQPSTYG